MTQKEETIRIIARTLIDCGRGFQISELMDHNSEEYKVGREELAKAVEQSIENLLILAGLREEAAKA